MEDLWGFNDERVARAIYNCSIPVISAVGHEPDFTISDFVADVRAATPSNGAELAVPDQAAIKEMLAKMESRIRRVYTDRLQMLAMRLEDITGRRWYQRPLDDLVYSRQRDLDLIQERLDKRIEKIILNGRMQLNLVAHSRYLIDPLASFADRRALLGRTEAQLERAMQEHLTYAKGEYTKAILSLDRSYPERIARLKYVLEQAALKLEQREEKSRAEKGHALALAAAKLDALSPLKALSRGYAYVRTDDGVILSTNAVSVGDTIYVHVQDGKLECQIVGISPGRSESNV